jgi:hypothetical protein
MISYWPSIIFQDDFGNLQEILCNGSIPGSLENTWFQRALGVHGYNASGLAEIPVTQNNPSNSVPVDYGVGVLYQRDDSKLYSVVRSTNIGEWSASKFSLS